MHSRQKTHRKCFDKILEVPWIAEDVLISNRINENPTPPILTDAELDALDMLKQRTAKPKGRGRGQGQGRSGGRGRAGRASSSSGSSE